jgi:hypothetical protein
MSTKKIIFILFTFVFISCTEMNKENNEEVKDQFCNYYLAVNTNLGYNNLTAITALNLEVGQITDIKVQKNELIYTLQFVQQEVLYTDSEILLEKDVIIIDNKYATGNLIPCGDTLKINIAPVSEEIPKKDSITAADIDSLQQRIQKLNQLIEQLDGTN